MGGGGMRLRLRRLRLRSIATRRPISNAPLRPVSNCRRGGGVPSGRGTNAAAEDAHRVVPCETARVAAAHALRAASISAAPVRVFLDCLFANCKVLTTFRLCSTTSNLIKSRVTVCVLAGERVILCEAAAE